MDNFYKSSDLNDDTEKSALSEEKSEDKVTVSAVEDKKTSRKRKKSTKSRVSKPEPATVEEEEVKRNIAIQSTPKHVAIQSCWSARVTMRDNPSGRTYIWGNAGTTVQVAIEDVDHIMSMNRSGTRGCCGSKGGHIYFVLA